MAGELKNEQYLMTLLTALIKREGGEVRISEETMVSVTKSDIVTLSYDTKTDEIVLRSNPALMPDIQGSVKYEN
tara:strand:+ start:102 stop:323 length:222 start_codon:yes stop_codon:yes gene_type:complete